MKLPRWINQSDRILIAPLNWGLGHATRCIPIINFLIQAGKTVVLASDGPALILLRKEFPQLTTVEIPGYNINYKHKSMVWNMLAQSLKLLRAIKSEKEESSIIVEKYGIDTIISDNRYGVRCSHTKNVIVCHQINIQHKNSFAARIATLINKRWINKFDECWIPDYSGNHSLAGLLSQPEGLNDYFFIGPVTRFKMIDTPIKRKWLLILSGPEPSRTQLENKLAAIFDKEDYLMVRGLPGYESGTDTRWVNHMSAEDLNREICSSDWVVCRSGYTSIMDLRVLNHKAILIPTPGQGEQEYLSEFIIKNHNDIFKVIREEDFKISAKGIDILGL